MYQSIFRSNMEQETNNKLQEYYDMIDEYDYMLEDDDEESSGSSKAGKMLLGGAALAGGAYGANKYLDNAKRKAYEKGVDSMKFKFTKGVALTHIPLLSMAMGPAALVMYLRRRKDLIKKYGKNYKEVLSTHR